MYDSPDIKITVKPKKSGSSTLAIVDLLLNGIHKVKGFTIMASHYGGFVVYPPRNLNKVGKWECMYYCEDKTVWKDLESKIIEEYTNRVFPEQHSTSSTI